MRVVVTVVLVLFALPGVAFAGGHNGKIGFVSKQNGPDEDIWVVNPDGTGATDVSNNTARDVDPAFSPDGSKIAFARFITGRNFDLFVMNADGTGERQITSTTASERMPSWAPDGKHLVYRRNILGGKFDIWTINLGPTGPGTGAKRLLTNPANDYDPDWSPKGDQIVFVSDRFGAPNSEIMIASSDGTNLRRLTNNTTPDTQPAWLADGSGVVWTSSREGHPAIYRMRPDGSGQIRLVPGATKDDYPAPSPDGTKLAFRRSSGSVDIWVANVNGSGAAKISGTTDGEVGLNWQTVPAPDVTVSQLALPSPATAGRPLTLEVTAHNGGTDAAPAVVLTDTLPPSNAAFVSAAGCTRVAGTVTCALGTIPAGGSRVVRIVVRPIAPGALVNKASAAAPGDFAPGNNGSSLTVAVHAAPASGPCTVTGTAGNDVLNGTRGRDVICGLGGSDVIRGFDGDDVILGGGGNDRIDGGPGKDRVSGGAGKDTIVGGSGNDRLSGDSGNDRIDGGAGVDRVDGGSGNDVIIGGRGRDRLIGGRGNDRFSARDNQRDIIDGGPGRDTASADRSPRDIVHHVERTRRR